VRLPGYVHQLRTGAEFQSALPAQDDAAAIGPDHRVELQSGPSSSFSLELEITGRWPWQ